MGGVGERGGGGQASCPGQGILPSPSPSPSHPFQYEERQVIVN